MENNRTDLACEELYHRKEEFFINKSKIVKSYITKEEAVKCQKKHGLYYSLYSKAVLNNIQDEIKELIYDFSEVIKMVIMDLKIPTNASCLVIGLGNKQITPDSLGPRVIEKILITKHLYELEGLSKGLRVVCGMAPGVMGTTGMETGKIVEAIAKEEKPDFVIVIDSLAASNLERVNQTIQISTAGINPGSGVGNSRKEISFETLGIPVISIGVPTVVDVVSITNDTIDYLAKHLFDELKTRQNRLLFMKEKNYQDIDVPDNNRKDLLGLVGSLNKEDIKKLIFEAIAPNGFNYMVTPKDIDLIITNFSKVIASSINIALHKNVN